MIIGIFSHFFALETTLAERQFFRAIAKLIARRAARLSACGIAAIVSKMGYLEEGCAVGADGSLYNVCTHRSPNVRTVLTASLFRRNTPALRNGYMKDYKTSSETRDSKCRACFNVRMNLASNPQENRYLSRRRRKRYWKCHRRRCVNYLLYVFCTAQRLILCPALAMTKLRKDAGLYPNL